MARLASALSPWSTLTTRSVMADFKTVDKCVSIGAATTSLLCSTCLKIKIVNIKMIFLRSSVKTATKATFNLCHTYFFTSVNRFNVADVTFQNLNKTDQNCRQASGFAFVLEKVLLEVTRMVVVAAKQNKTYFKLFDNIFYSSFIKTIHHFFEWILLFTRYWKTKIIF